MHQASNERKHAPPLGVSKFICSSNCSTALRIHHPWRGQVDPWVALIPYVLGGIGACRAVFANDALCSALAYGAVLHMLVSTELAITRSFRSHVLCAVLNVSASLAFDVSLFIE